MSWKHGWSQWISLSDMMTWLMLVFLLISVLVISEIQKKEKEKNRILIEYNNTKEDLFKELKKAYIEKEKEWEMTIEDDLSIKFTNPDVLFEPNVSTLTQGFKNILNEFIPLYISIVNDEKYKDSIIEVRIEWHAGKCTDMEYMQCLELSQDRSNAVLLYIFNHPNYVWISEENKRKLKFWLTSNWMSNWRNLDEHGEYIYYSKEDLSAEKSRRVEFRIITNSEALIEQIMKKNNLLTK